MGSIHCPDGVNVQCSKSEVGYTCVSGWLEKSLILLLSIVILALFSDLFCLTWFQYFYLYIRSDTKMEAGEPEHLKNVDFIEGPPAALFTSSVAPEYETDGSFMSAFIATFSMIVVSELGDKTFFIAGIFTFLSHSKKI